ncbi:MAG TPA: TIGR02281 family clan AA aspartic protease [Xenococcaceae cyanobacterium]
MDKIAKSIFLALVASLIPSQVLGQPESECFMLDRNGNSLDLRYLCGEFNDESATQTITNPRRVTPKNSRAEVFAVPIKRQEGGTPVIEVKFNDRYVFEMLVDTGATWTIITSQMAQTLKLKPQGSLIFKTVAGNVELAIAQVDSVTTGGVMQENLNIAIAPTMSIGLLGQNFSDRYNLFINSTDGVIEFHPK